MAQTRVHIRPRRRSELEIIPLGGCGEIGMNLTLYGFESRWIIVDCGMTIRQDLPDTPLQLPDIEALAERDIHPEALILTHGHEDHLGALGWLWPRLGCPIHATPLAAGLARQKLVEKGLATGALRVFQPGDAFEAGPFSITTMAVTHSIPESVSLLLEVDRHRVLHTGDWKLDPEPLIGPATRQDDFTAIAPVDLLVGDSTNAHTEGWSRSESEVAGTLAQALEGLEGRVVISCFASNLARIRAIGRAATRQHRRIALLGRAMEKMVRLGRELGYLDDFPEPVPLSDIGYLPRKEILLLATGSQGEPRAALSRLAINQHPVVEIEHGDCVLFSSRTIPGNEEAVERLKHAFRRQGASVLSEDNLAGLHASGHPAREELRRLYGWLRPRHLLPVHGEQAHQQAHASLAKELGIGIDLLPQNGQHIQWNGKRLQLAEQWTLSPQLVSQRRRQHRDDRRHDATVLVVPVSREPDSERWTRIGRLMIDSSIDAFIDERTLGDWVDRTLEALEAPSTNELSHRLEEHATHWLQEHLRHSSKVVVDVVDATP
ncbi:ribonuclease J [Kushneria aurantia]|uniref:Ribonuclease J n=1 Tax=Kushneria aurantia TaxID=504092 RepID=A0ABV6G120_9GAMM|nr:ribonuclease J [Kushneria aurantia]